MRLKDCIQQHMSRTSKSMSENCDVPIVKNNLFKFLQILLKMDKILYEVKP